MPFIGNKPSAVPLTSADIADGIITSAKIVDATITNSDVASSIITGQTAETSIAGGDSVLIYDDSASALRKMTRTNFVSGIGGTNTPIFVAKSSSDQSVSATTWTKINFGTEDIDTGSLFASSRFTVNFTGKVFLNAKLILETLSDQKFLVINIYKNGGASSFGSQSISNSGTYEIALQTSVIDSCVSTDYYEVYFYHNDTTSRPLRGDKCVFSGFKLIE